jgi:hypothetical protein
MESTFTALEAPSEVKEFRPSADNISMAFAMSNDFAIPTTFEIQYLLANQVDYSYAKGISTSPATLRGPNDGPAIWLGRVSQHLQLKN